MKQCQAPEKEAQSPTQTCFCSVRVPKVVALEFFCLYLHEISQSASEKKNMNMSQREIAPFQSPPVEDLVREVLARPLERTSHDAFHPLTHLLSDQLLQIQPTGFLCF